MTRAQKFYTQYWSIVSVTCLFVLSMPYWVKQEWVDWINAHHEELQPFIIFFLLIVFPCTVLPWLYRSAAKIADEELHGHLPDKEVQ